MVAEYISSLKVAWDIAKAVQASTDAIEDAELKLKIANLIGALADARIKSAENDERIVELEKRLCSKSEMKFDGAVYYRENENNERDGPWCPRCFDADGKEVRLQAGYSSSWICANCNKVF